MADHNIPIDINTTKLLDWLVSRRHVNKDWQNDILKIREKINNAIQDMPAHEGIIKLLSGQHINYFHCLKIIEILKDTEADTKNLFGRYGSQRMKDWQDIVQSYLQSSLYLAEIAQVLIRNVNFEVPSLRKQVAKFEQVQGDCEKKIKDYTKSEALTLNDFNSACKQLGIPGNNIKQELIHLLDQLPQLYEEAAKKINSVKSAVDLYLAFTNFHTGKDCGINLLPMLRYVIANGNTTTYEYTYGEKPVFIHLPTLKFAGNEAEEDASDEIDFGLDDRVGEIDFSEIDVTSSITDITDVSGDKEEIDWGTVTTEEGFEIVEHTDLNINLEESGIVVEHSGLDEGVAQGEYALTVLDNPKTKDQIVNDLMELAAFLKMRLFEMSSESDLLSMSQMQDAPALLQMQTTETVTAMSDFVEIALNELVNKRALHLHNIKHSPKYIDMLTTSLKQKLAVVERLQETKKLLKDNIEDARKQNQNILPVINVMIENIKLLQKQIEEDISKRYKGRPVHIVGGVNML